MDKLLNKKLACICLSWITLICCLTLIITVEPLSAGVLRLVAYNTYNNPDNSTEDESFRIIFNAIGNESVNGVAKRLDLLMITETDTDSSVRLSNILNTLYGVSNSYQVVVTNPDGGNDRTGIVFDSSTLTLLNSKELKTGLTHNVLRANFRTVSTSDPEEFFIYVIHLKSGSTSEDRKTRTTEVSLIRNDADALGEGTNIIYAGDFNLLESEEGAWTNLLSAGAGQGFDAANAPGKWRDNPTFKHLHTQNPRSNMDDRFDIQFVSSELLDGAGLEYSANSFHVFGNNGTHTLGGAISSGIGASPQILSALEASSDHLPVMADYTFGDTMTPKIIPPTLLLLLND